VYSYDAFDPLISKYMAIIRIADCSLEGDYSKIQPGDCVVAFSRAEIFSIKREIERLTPYKCCTVYGALPPETR
jgi:ATP-dependent RNA helicase SUPV3L1/SUV3